MYICIYTQDSFWGGGVVKILVLGSVLAFYGNACSEEIFCKKIIKNHLEEMRPREDFIFEEGIYSDPLGIVHWGVCPLAMHF